MINQKQLVHEYLKNLNLNSVLDLGCGQGEKSLRFAEKNISVTGVDKKDIKIKQKKLKFIQQDIRDFKFKEKYDLIIASLVLHFFRKEKAIEIIRKIQKNTNSKGFNFLICMSNKGDLSKGKPENFYTTLKELKKIYKDWEIIQENQGFTDYEEHGNLKSHRHNLIFLLLKKII